MGAVVKNGNFEVSFCCLPECEFLHINCAEFLTRLVVTQVQAVSVALRVKKLSLSLQRFCTCQQYKTAKAQQDC